MRDRSSSLRRGSLIRLLRKTRSCLITTVSGGRRRNRRHRTELLLGRRRRKTRSLRNATSEGRKVSTIGISSLTRHSINLRVKTLNNFRLSSKQLNALTNSIRILKRSRSIIHRRNVLALLIRALLLLQHNSVSIRIGTAKTQEAEVLLLRHADILNRNVVTRNLTILITVETSNQKEVVKLRLKPELNHRLTVKLKVTKTPNVNDILGQRVVAQRNTITSVPHGNVYTTDRHRRCTLPKLNKLTHFRSR
nr:MAG TPA: hypothetical protein [Caudoviricetes sp.]